MSYCYCIIPERLKDWLSPLNDMSNLCFTTFFSLKDPSDFIHPTTMRVSRVVDRFTAMRLDSKLARQALATEEGKVGRPLLTHEFR